MKFKLKRSKKISNLVYYDSETKLVYSSSSNNIVPYMKKIDNKLKIVSTFPFDSLMKTTIEVPKALDEADIADFLADNAYKQLNIQTDMNYELSFFKIDSSFDADNWTYDVYLVDAKYLEKTYEDIQDKVSFIDVVTTIPFLPLVLYKTNKIETIANHIFVFIGSNSGTFIFYGKGEPVYIKTLGSNIHRLRVEFNQQSSLELNSLEFENFIAGKSPDAENYKSHIDSMLNSISRDIEENIMYIKRVYQDLDPTALYFGMSIEYDEKFLDFFRDTFLIETKPFNSLASIDTPKGLFAIVDIAMTYASYLVANPLSNLPNFSHLKRPKPLSQRDCSQFIMIASGLLVLSLVYPIYNFSLMGYFGMRTNMLQTSYDTEVFPKAEEYRAKEATLKANITKLQEDKKRVDEEIVDLRKDMGAIYTWQVGYIQKSKILNDILQVANSSKVRVRKATLNSADNQDLIIELNLFAKSQQDITDFIKVLSEKGDYKSVITDKIEKIGLDESARNKLNTELNTFMDSVAKVADSATNALNNISSSNRTAIRRLSAEVNIGDNEELDAFVNGYLNSIVKVVVR